MKIISFDVGTRNLAYCLAEFTADDNIIPPDKMMCRIDDWNMLDLGGSGNTTEKCSLILTRVLSETFMDIPSLNIDYVLVERQPKRSISMLAVQMFLCQYFSTFVLQGYIKGVHFVSPKLKLERACLKRLMHISALESEGSVLRGRARYTKNKRDAILLTRHVLEHVLIDHAKLVEFDAAHKRDDLADAFLQALCWWCGRV